MRGRMDRARRDDDFTAPELRLLAFDERLHADATRPFEDQPLDLRERRDLQILAQPGARIEIADRRRDAAIVEIRDRDRKIAVLELAVLILDVLKPSPFECFSHRLGVAVPEIWEYAAHRDTAFVAVPRPVE